MTTKLSQLSKLEEEIKKKKKRIARLKRKLRNEKKRRRRQLKRETKRLRREVREAREIYDDLLSVGDIVDAVRSRFNQIVNSKGKLLGWQANAVLQRLCRDVLDEVASRWADGIRVPELNRNTVKVRDYKAYLPMTQSGSRDYADSFYGFVSSVFGLVGDNAVYEDFLKKLANPDLILRQFQMLYFHQFLQSTAEITDFPCVAVEHLRIIKYVNFDNMRNALWTVAYGTWAAINNQDNIDLEDVVGKDILAWRAFDHRGGYEDTPVVEASLVRNFIRHFNENLKDPRIHPYGKSDSLYSTYSQELD